MGFFPWIRACSYVRLTDRAGQQNIWAGDVVKISDKSKLLQQALEIARIYRLIFSSFWSDVYLFLFASTFFKFCCSNSSLNEIASNSSPKKGLQSCLNHIDVVANSSQNQILQQSQLRHQLWAMYYEQNKKAACLKHSRQRDLRHYRRVRTPDSR